MALLLGSFCILQTGIAQKTIHVSVKGKDSNTGNRLRPLRTITAAANKAMPGDTVLVHAGVYRERVDPPRGGNAANERIWYLAAPGEQVEIKGSELVKGWKRVSGSVWKATIPNKLFKGFNPYKDTIYGDWLAKGNWCHTGEVYLNDQALTEARNLDQLMAGRGDTAFWYSRVTENETSIWAGFNGINPNRAQVEINVRQAVFYPSKTGIDYIGVKGFRLSQAATPWAPPTAEQIGLIGTHWSKGWVIEKNTVRNSKCVGITLGKYGDAWDNRSESVEGYIKTIERAADNGWDKAHVGSHQVQDNEISDCGQAGIAGSLGAVYSRIAGNTIHRIGVQRLFWGYELAGIKLHGAVDVEISHNHIFQTEGGIWLDWMAQGTRVTGNFLHDNRVQDLSLEVNHGPVIIDNNMFLSPQLAQVRLSQGVAFIHNLIAWQLWPTDSIDHRKTPFLKPHTTTLAGLHSNPCGDTRFYNNVFIGKADLRPYDQASLPIAMEGNVYLMNTKPARHEKTPLVLTGYDPGLRVEEKDGRWYLAIDIKKAWANELHTTIITTGKLGMAVIPQQGFEDPDGQPLVFDKDYLGRQRSGHPQPGPFEWSSDGPQRMRIW
ncbi:right-handed parallel beta-helix repeat-containing protein [Niabella hirudinis]|uniref:right-handed parallel beta-helix repeat-containing protein n=1 Tax=Niabella hirudinis TaxID=1285929 RepID=UPI003EB83960